jgi:DNA-directed RNA polymerase delta subunit
LDVWYLDPFYRLSQISKKTYRFTVVLKELTQHVEEKPVSNVALLDNGVDHLSPDQPETDVQEVGSHFGADDDYDAVDDDQEAEDGESDEPEPEEDVDLFIDYVEGQEAECVVFLDLPGCSELVERAFGHSEKN